MTSNAKKSSCSFCVALFFRGHESRQNPQKLRRVVKQGQSERLWRWPPYISPPPSALARGCHGNMINDRRDFRRAHISAERNCGRFFWWLWRILRLIFRPGRWILRRILWRIFCLAVSSGKRRILWRILRPGERGQRRKKGETNLGGWKSTRKSTIKIHAELQVKHAA